MESLDHLTLNYNRLKSLEAGFFKGLESLTTLYIDHNQIRLINKDAFVGLEGVYQMSTHPYLPTYYRFLRLISLERRMTESENQF